MLNNKQKAIIHVAKAKVGMSDEDYRAMLASYGAGSSSELTYADFLSVMRRFRKLGFETRGSNRAGAQSGAVGNVGASGGRPLRSKDLMIRKIDAICAEIGLTRAYADGIAKRMFQRDRVQFCDADQVHKIVAAMVYRQRAHRGGYAPGRNAR